MHHYYRVYFDVDNASARKRVVDLLAECELQLDTPGTVLVHGDSAARHLLAAANSRGIKASLDISTQYDRADALTGELGALRLGAASTTHFRAVLPNDAFDLADACPHCGLGCMPVKPHVLRKESMRSRSNFEYGNEGTALVLMRSEIGREIVEATGQPECMRHPVLRSGEVVKDWMEAVPTATLPPLSRKSAGILRGSTHALSDVGEPARSVPPCPECKRTIWSESHEEPTRLVYSRAAIKSVRQHAVVLMHEPPDMFPKFDRRKRVFTSLYCYPWPLFSRAAIKVLLKYMQTEHIRDSAWIRPVFSE